MSKTTTMVKVAVAALAVLLAAGCDKIDNKAVPNYTVRIDLGSYALWNTYGVSGLGDYRIFNRDKGLPSNFPYNVNTYTGYGGVLLMMGFETSSGDYAPLAYDLSCPVEVSQGVTVSIDSENFDAICSKCGSHFDVLQGAGGPKSGVALTNKLGLRSYRVTPSNGGYMISN